MRRDGQVASDTAGRTGSGGRRSGRPYRKRRPLPALLFLGTLCVAAVVVWVNAISSSPDLAESIACEPRIDPSEGTTFTRLPHDTLLETSPLPPSLVEVTVLNANGTRGEASIATEELRRLGFTRVTEPRNDEVYTDGVVADCHGQIRFGPEGERAARTVQLIDPCLELVQDGRNDASVDLAIGTKFNDFRMSDAAVDILDRLKSWESGEAAETDEQSLNDEGPVIEPELLTETLPKHC